MVNHDAPGRPPIDGHTELIVHIGFPTHSFKAPLIYNPYFAAAGIGAVVVPMSCRPEAFAGLLRRLFRLDNVRGALITMPHKVSVVAELDQVSRRVRVAAACNAVRRTGDGRLEGELFDGEGFVRGLQAKGLALAGAAALVLGCGGVGSAIAASLAEAGVARLALHDLRGDAATALAARLRAEHGALQVTPGSADPAGFDLVVNATPLGMEGGDALPLDPARLEPRTFVGDVVLREQLTPLLAAARARGCRVQPGLDMLFEQIPAYLEFFGLPVADAQTLRALAQLDD